MTGRDTIYLVVVPYHQGEMNMKFHEFAQILHSLIGGKKYDFTIDLLKAGLDAEGVEYIKSLRSDEPGKSRIRKFLLGKNDITEIAPNILISFRQHLFVDYIFETIDESSYSELCKKFRESTDHLRIEENDVPQKLAEIFEKILKNAAKGKTPPSETHYDTTQKFSISVRHKERMDNLIDELRYMVNQLFYGYEGQESSVTFLIQYERFLSLNANLSAFSEIYPFLKTLCRITEHQLKPRDFYLLNDDGAKKRLEYAALLNSIRSELLKYPSNNH